MNRDGIYSELPPDMGIALLRNNEALNNFVMLPDTQKRAFMQRAGNVSTPQELTAIVDEIAIGQM
ncbi:MAG: hypothetical protein LBM18_04885 [Oscillospiraceae bacterium]|jgi:hypothetical protein|nr:hypothetical protein [Oscillospiraceae bacterium]